MVTNATVPPKAKGGKKENKDAQKGAAKDQKKGK